ncbi:gas vesicle protein GvpO [Flexibacterium corallicola]|uniref:gas vesicle protein GvpO n=1 Tax=Flexibacterium corallicola TaxID=3037259 RepID=UPI00286ECADB|nr:gas vesicle protein GvpO [Pseudovibrio sp. M1P-2-3]
MVKSSETERLSSLSKIPPHVGATVAKSLKDGVKRKTAKEKPIMASAKPVSLIAGAKLQLKELTGYPVDSIAEFKQIEGGWSLTSTVIELERIPSSTDVLAEYLIDLDPNGDIISYRRGRRFYRGDVGAME